MLSVAEGEFVPSSLSQFSARCSKFGNVCLFRCELGLLVSLAVRAMSR